MAEVTEKPFYPFYVILPWFSPEDEGESNPIPAEYSVYICAEVASMDLRRKTHKGMFLIGALGNYSDTHELVPVTKGKYGTDIEAISDKKPVAIDFAGAVIMSFPQNHFIHQRMTKVMKGKEDDGVVITKDTSDGNELELVREIEAMLIGKDFSRLHSGRERTMKGPEIPRRHSYGGREKLEIYKKLGN